MLRNDLDPALRAVTAQQVDVGWIRVRRLSEGRTVDVRTACRKRRTQGLSLSNIEGAVTPRAQPRREPNRTVQRRAGGTRARPVTSLRSFNGNTARFKGRFYARSFRAVGRASLCLVLYVPVAKRVGAPHVPDPGAFEARNA